MVAWTGRHAFLMRYHIFVTIVTRYWPFPQYKRASGRTQVLDVECTSMREWRRPLWLVLTKIAEPRNAHHQF